MPKLRIKKTNYYTASILLCILIPWTAITKCHQMSVRPKSLQSCLTLCDPVDCSPPGSSVRGIFQARMLKWAATPSSRDLLDPGVEPASPVLAGGLFFFITSATWEACHQMGFEKQKFTVSSSWKLDVQDPDISKRNLGTHTHIGRKPCEDGSRDQNDASTGQKSDRESHSVMSDSLWLHVCGILQARILEWVGSCSLLQEICPSQGANPGLPHCRWILYQLSHQGSLYRLRNAKYYQKTTRSQGRDVEHITPQNTQKVPTPPISWSLIYSL